MSKKRGKRQQKSVFVPPSSAKPAEPAEATTEARTDPPAPKPVRETTYHKILYWFLCAAFVVLPFSIAPGFFNPYNKAFYVIVLTAAISCIILTIAVAKKIIPVVVSPFFVAVGLWLLAKLITTITSMSPAKSFWGSYNSWSDGFVFGLSVAVILLVILSLQLSSGRIARLLNLLIAQAVVVAGFTVGQAVQAGFFYQKVRPDSPLLNADFFISYAVLFLPLLLILLLLNVRRRDFMKAGLYALGTIILSAGLFVALPTHLQTILLPALLNGKKDSTYGATDVKSIGAENFTQTNANLERWTEWKIGITMGAQRPLVGTGPSTTGQAFILNKNRLDLTGWDHTHVMTRSHNDVIEQFSQEGLLGLGAYLILWVSFAWIAIKRWRHIDQPNRPYAWGLAGGLVLWLGFNVLLFTTLVAGLMAWVWVALLLAIVKSVRVINVRWAQPARAAIIGLSLCMAWIGFWIVHYYVDDIAVTRAARINTGLGSGAYASLSPDERINLRLQSESVLSGAADDITSEDYYAYLAALSAIDTYINVKFKDLSDTTTRSNDALRYARQAVAADPYSPANLQTLGGIEYYLAPNGSADEIKGIALIDRAIVYTPKSVAWYLNAARIAALKKDFVLARSYIQRGQAATVTPHDHEQLNKLGDSFPKS